MNISVIGTGYVGLVVGSCFAESGNDVVCVDINEKKIADLKKGIIPIYEPGLPDLIERNVRDQRLIFSTDLAAAIRRSQVIFIAVGTPTTPSGAADLSAVHAVATSIGKAMNDYKVVVTKSTVPVGTADAVKALIEKETKISFDVVSNPEFLKQGAAVDDFMRPDRIVLGSCSARAIDLLQEIYAPFVRTGSPIQVVDIRTAEMVKYAANAFLAARISFMNEISNLCEAVGADVDLVRKGIAADSRIGSAFLFPGVGYGGSCFPKDTRALIQTGLQFSTPMRILEAVEAVNGDQAIRFVNRVIRHYDDKLDGKRFGVWGLSFKPKTNDMRDAPAIPIIERLLTKGASISAYDPEAMDEGRKIFGSRIEFAPNNYECLVGADALLLLTEWQLFRNPNIERMKDLMRCPVVFDGRNIYEPGHLRELGFTYFGIGKK